jgi:hypothetical protein
MSELNNETKWYDKEQITKIFNISVGTYYKKRRLITDSEKIKIVGKSKLIHHSIVGEVFSRKNKKKHIQTEEELKNFRAWSAVHCYYGLDSWLHICDQIGENHKGEIPNEKIEGLIKDFIDKIKSSNSETDVNFMNDHYNKDLDRYEKIIREEYLGNLKHFMK